jgi:hypothetical protein
MISAQSVVRQRAWTARIYFLFFNSESSSPIGIVLIPEESKTDSLFSDGHKLYKLP